MPLPMRPIPITPTLRMSDAIEFTPFQPLTHVSLHSPKIPHAVYPELSRRVPDDGSINFHSKLNEESFRRLSNCHGIVCRVIFNYGQFSAKSDSYFSRRSDAFWQIRRRVKAIHRHRPRSLRRYRGR